VANPSARLVCISPLRPYGVRITTAGAGSWFGNTKSAASVTPSRNGIRTLKRLVSLG
jgi:hypothetical protein